MWRVDCVSSGLGKHMSLLSAILVYPFTQSSTDVTYVTLSIY